MIIKTIHLMNFANADRLAPIVNMRRSEKARACGELSALIQQIQENQGGSLQTMPGLENIQQVGRKWRDVTGDRVFGL